MFTHRVLMMCWFFAIGAAVGQAQPSVGSPQEAVRAFKAALEAGDFKKLGTLAAGEPATVFAALAEPMAKAKAASDRFDRALIGKNISFKNIIAAGVTPWAELQFDLVEVTKENNQTLARVKYGFRGRTQEETVLLQPDGGGWRVGLPAELAKQLPAKGGLDRRVAGLNKLAGLLDVLSGEIEQGKRATKDAVSQRLIELLAEAKLSEAFR